MGDHKGTGNDSKASPGKFFLLREAECSDSSSEDGADCEQDAAGDSQTEAGDFLDDDPVDQGASNELYHQQETEEANQQIQVLKRKLLGSPQHSTPERPAQEVEVDLAISPILQECRITPKKCSAKKKICFADRRENEARNYATAPLHALDAEVESTPGPSGRQEPEGAVCKQSSSQAEATVVYFARPSTASTSGYQGSTAQETLDSFDQSNFVRSLLRTQNQKARVLYKINDSMGVPMSEVCRVFRSNKTGSQDWVVAVVGVREETAKAAHEQLVTHTEFILSKSTWSEGTPVSFHLIRFKASKSRECVHRLFRAHMVVEEVQLCSNPPKTGSTAAALYWYKLAAGNVWMNGEMLEWIKTHTEVAHMMAGETQFDLSNMVQWAYDNDMFDEAKIAFGYAQLADSDKNAMAFIRSNSQARFVKDCATMVRFYKRAEMREMTMPEWIDYRSSKIEGDNPEGWRKIVRFLRHQHIEVISFLIMLKYFLKGIPKRNCIVLQGEPDTGKSLFAMSLINFLDGKVLTFANSRSHFWLQPAADAKIALVDDCTDAFWHYCDTYLRNALDGNHMSIDCKHRVPMQITFPPLLLTTNVYLQKDPKWKYLLSRVRILTFDTVIRNVEGNNFLLKGEDWKSFFDKYKRHLGFETVDDDGTEDGSSRASLRVSTRRDL